MWREALCLNRHPSRPPRPGQRKGTWKVCASRNAKTTEYTDVHPKSIVIGARFVCPLLIGGDLFRGWKMENNYQTYSMYRSWNDVQIFEYFVIRANFSALLLYLSTGLKCRVQLPFKLKYWKTYWMIQQFCCRINIKIGQELLTLLLVLKYFLFIPPPSFPCWLYKYLSRIAHEVFIPFVNNFSNVFFFKYQNIYTRIRFILIEIVFSNSRIV